MTHCNAVGYGDGVKPARHTAALFNTAARDIGLVVQHSVAWRAVIAGGRDTNEGPRNLFFG
jgi:hypothetical protein